MWCSEELLHPADANENAIATTRTIFLLTK
jgi:hypothetical protein